MDKEMRENYMLGAYKILDSSLFKYKLELNAYKSGFSQYEKETYHLIDELDGVKYKNIFDEKNIHFILSLIGQIDTLNIKLDDLDSEILDKTISFNDVLEKYFKKEDIADIITNIYNVVKKYLKSFKYYEKLSQKLLSLSNELRHILDKKEYVLDENEILLEQVITNNITLINYIYDLIRILSTRLEILELNLSLLKSVV